MPAYPDLVLVRESLSQDPILAKLLDQFPLKFNSRQSDLVEDLVSAVISQQLSVKAADTIYKRFLNLFGDKFPGPEAITTLEIETLRDCGISRAKATYIQGIANSVVSRELEPEKMNQLDDTQVIAELTKLPGIGPWTAEMILIFSLKRPDVFSVGDLGLRTAVSRHYKVDRDNHEAILKMAEKWKPYRSYASRLLWSSLDNSPK